MVLILQEMLLQKATMVIQALTQRQPALATEVPEEIISVAKTVLPKEQHVLQEEIQERKVLLAEEVQRKALQEEALPEAQEAIVAVAISHLAAAEAQVLLQEQEVVAEVLLQNLLQEAAVAGLLLNLQEVLQEEEEVSNSI